MANGDLEQQSQRLEPSQLTWTQVTTPAHQPPSTPVQRIRLSPAELQQLIECCLDRRSIYREVSRDKWWIAVSEDLKEATGKQFNNCQQKVREEVKSRRKAKNNEDPGDDPGTTNYQRILDQWIDFIDAIDQEKRQNDAQKLADREQEQRDLEELQVACTQRIGQRNQSEATPSRVFEGLTPVDSGGFHFDDEIDLEEDGLLDTSFSQASETHPVSNQATRSIPLNDDPVRRLTRRSNSRGSSISKASRGSNRRYVKPDNEDRMLKILGDLASKFDMTAESSNPTLEERILQIERIQRETNEQIETSRAETSAEIASSRVETSAMFKALQENIDLIKMILSQSTIVPSNAQDRPLAPLEGNQMPSRSDLV